MRESLQQYTIGPNASILDAFRKIDSNTSGFLIVTESDDIAVGVLTDGDIRRGFIKGGGLDCVVSDICRKEFTALRISDGLDEAIELFKRSSIKFLPVLDDGGKLANLITKPQIHALLLQDISADITFDFLSLDEGIVDFEIYPRPWGFYKSTVINNYFQSKIISVIPGGTLSLQLHNRREEYWIVAHGTGIVQIGESLKNVKCGSSLFIPKGCKHRLTNTDDKENLIITEVQIGDYFGEDDIIRYEDKYGRA